MCKCYLEELNIKLSRNMLYDSTIGSKRKKRGKDMAYTNGESLKDAKHNSASKRKRNSVTNETQVAKKRKKKDISNMPVNNKDDIVNHNELNGDIHQEFAVDIGSNCSKIVKGFTNKNNQNCADGEDISSQKEHFNGKFLRQSLNSTNALDMLRKFVKMCNDDKEQDLAAEYLDAGGSILEILRLLDTTDRKGIGAATTVFSAVKILLMKILAQYPQQQYNAEGACRHLINSHLSLVHSMLSVQSNAKQRKLILQLLAVIVSLGGTLPRDLLNHLSLPPEVVKSLVQHTKPMDNQNVRNCFVHFILAFLIEGNLQTIRILLDKRELLLSIFPDLVYDSKDIVSLILTTLKTYILQNPSISKTMKLQIFSTPVIQNLVCLYNWKGPYHWPKHKCQNVLPSAEYLEEKQIVTEILHDFLILLLTSHRYGIIFHDRLLGTSRVKHNHMLNTILQSLDRPWEHEKPSNLVIKIMRACPELIRSQFTLLEPYIEPRISLKWVAVMKFVREMIQSIDAENCIKTSSLELNAVQLANAITSLTMPPVLMKQAISPSLINSSIIVRHEAIITLTCIFHQIKTYLATLKTVCKRDSDYCMFENIVTDFILKNIPDVNMILNVWNYVFEPVSNEENDNEKDDISEPGKEDHLMAVLNLLHMYEEVCPKLLDTLPDMQPEAFLKILDNLKEVPFDKFNAIKVKAIQFLVILYSHEFLPHKKIFKEVLSFLISILNEDASSHTSYASTTMKTLLNATGMFEACSDQLNIWINGFINLEERKKVIKWFISSIKETAVNIDRYVNTVIDAEEIINEDIVHVEKSENIFSDLLNRSSMNENVNNSVVYMQRLTSISPLLCCMLQRKKEDLHPSILAYLSYILVHTLHYQVAPQCLIHLIKDIESLPVKEYLSSWLVETQPVPIKRLYPSLSLACELSLAFLTDAKLEISKIFSGNNAVTVQYNNENITVCHSLTKYEITYLFKMSTFYLAQLIKRGSLTETQYGNYKIFLIALLYIAKDNADNTILVEECVKSFFTHPVILHYFSPLHKKSRDLTRNMITLMVVDICNVVIQLCNKNNVRCLFFHFKNKFLSQLNKMMDKQQRGEKIHNVETVTTLLELLQPTPTDVVRLLKGIVKLENAMFISIDETNLSLYGYAIPKLLNIINNNEIKHERSVLFELDIQFVRNLCLHLLFLKSKSISNSTMWEAALHGYLYKYTYNIAGIDADIFTSFLSTNFTDTTVKLISFLVKKSMKFIPIFAEAMIKSSNIEKGDIVLPVLASNLKFKWNQDFLQKLKKHYEADVLSYLCDPKDVKPWIEENIEPIRYLIKNSFDFETCNQACNTILQIGNKLDVVSINYIKLLECVYNKCVEIEKKGEKSSLNLIQVLLHILTLTLKREAKNDQKLRVLSESLTAAIKRLKEKNEDFVFEELSRSNSWSQFTRFSLKLGLKVSKNKDESVTILKTLHTLCSIAYKTNSESEYVKTLFDMAASHSEFITIMLGSSSTKRDLVELLWVLMQKNRTVIALTHVPLYLAAYGATLSETDQYILHILQYYESNGVNIYDYRPYVWGNTAAIHYSVKGETDTKLWRQPTVTQVLNLFEENIVNNTIANYPVDRALKSNELYKADSIYDPAFYLPLLCFLLSENNVVYCHKVAQSGALALVLAACSSMHSDVRMVAYTIIARFYAHLEASSSKAKLLPMRLMDALRYGVVSQELKLNNVRLNCLVSTFLARTSLITTQPLHPLYTALQTFLMAKPALDVNTIPELLQLFHSSDVEHKAHRYWILENIRDGMKTEIELNVAFKCALFKMLLDFYTCILSDLNAKKLILEILNGTLKISKAPILLMEGHGLLPWLLEVTRNAHTQEAQHVELLVKIMDKLLDTILNMRGDVVYYKLMLLNVTLCLKLHLVQDIRISVFTMYINMLQKLILTKQMKEAVPRDYITDILECSKKLLGDMEECKHMLRFGCKYITKVECVNENDETELARNGLRTLVWTWCVHEENNDCAY